MTSYMLLVERIAALKAEIERKDGLIDEASNILYRCVDSERCIYKATLLLEKAMLTKDTK